MPPSSRPTRNSAWCKRCRGAPSSLPWTRRVTRFPALLRKTAKPLPKNPIKDIRVRQAISKAINRGAIAQRVMEGMAIPASNVVAPPVFGYAKELQPGSLRRRRREEEAAGGRRLSRRLRHDRLPRAEQPLRQRRADRPGGGANAPPASASPPRSRPHRSPSTSATRATANIPSPCSAGVPFSGDLALRSLLATPDADKRLRLLELGPPFPAGDGPTARRCLHHHRRQKRARSHRHPGP